ncbi:MAG: hypothetical protein U9N77_14965, partial [Thermodesulfobacteriota bacterium]|nr:hypothetical protein [Thermodesulfobacteriota bacterium]
MQIHSLDYYFKVFNKETAVFKSLQDGYTRIEINEYLSLSNVSIDEIITMYKQKINLFNKLRNKGIFWSYARDIQYDTMDEAVFIEYILKYGDFADIKS